MMRSSDILALLPFIVLAATPVVAMLAVSAYRSHYLTAAVSVAGLTSSFLALPISILTLPRQVTPLIIIDGYTLFFAGLIILSTLAVVLLSYRYLESYDGPRDEYYILLLFAALGATIVAASTHFASFFLGLEILGVSLYAIIAYLKTSTLGVEAGIKYLILAAASDAFLLFGMALIYAESGTLEFARMTPALLGKGHIIALGGFAMLLVGIGFKLSLAPFHMWTPDVYQGAPAPVTAFLATVSKGAVFALLLRYFTEIKLDQYGSLMLLFSIIAVASMFVGNLLALLQDNVKRILAYASIAHFGYLLVAFLTTPGIAGQAVGYYLVAYFIATIGAFGVIGFRVAHGTEAEWIEDYRGLMWREPLLAAVLTVMLLSLAGIPLTAGFLGKFYVMAAGVKSSLWTLIIALIVTSVIGLYYYLRIIAAMCRRPEEGAQLVSFSPGYGSGFLLAILTFLVFLLGLYPGYFMQIVQSSLAL
jgi:NADH-quinone oxidoreductase subunit N